MSRKPYHHAQPSNWYTQNRFYRLYMLRELTALPTAIAALNLFWGLASFAGSADAWHTWISVQRHPIAIVANIIIIASSLYNSKTWFEAIPKAMPIQRGTKFVPASTLIKAAWGAFAAVFFIITLGTIIAA